MGREGRRRGRALRSVRPRIRGVRLPAKADAIPEQIEGRSRARSARASRRTSTGWSAGRSDTCSSARTPTAASTTATTTSAAATACPTSTSPCTALSALALLEWSAIEPERIKAAVATAAAYLSDESHVATGNTQERVWAHSYRILFFAKLATAGGPLAEQAQTKLRDVVKRLQELQADERPVRARVPEPVRDARPRCTR